MAARKKAADFGLFLSVLGLLGIGLTMILSASEYSALVRFGDALYFFKRQLLWALLGVGAMFFTMRLDYWHWKRWAPAMLVIGFLLLVAVFIPGVGRASHGATRWIGFGSLTVQPSELVKLCLIVFTAYGLAEKGEAVRSFRQGVLPFLLLALAAAGLILAQPDLGTAVTLTGTIFIMLFAAGARLGTLVGLGLAALPALGAAIYLERYRLQRFLAFINPWQDPQGSGFHIIQSLYALGSGGLFGVGLGQGKQKYLYLPEQHTDFIFAVIGEELGFVGACTVLALFGIFIWRGLRIAATAPDDFGSLLATGLTAGIALQALINMGVVCGVLPVTGITLPMVSFGGTSLLFTLAGVGILLNISRYRRRY
ncbi:MAG: stage V sporulation protein E [Bacillota bacterium]